MEEHAPVRSDTLDKTLTQTGPPVTKKPKVKTVRITYMLTNTPSEIILFLLKQVSQISFKTGR